ncbi:hypothetical protein [Rothia sp. CCM 9416]|uniref:hypothetical protein n=1 Tax=Rothia sp. CCM 9416 TaxID=3402655 RepID=UPI003AE67769
MPNSYPKDSSTAGEPDSITEPLPKVENPGETTPSLDPEPPAASGDATDVLTLANGYEYVTADSGSQRTEIDIEDDSLALGLMKNGDEFEKLTRRERRADRSAERAAALEQAEKEQQKLAFAAERDRLAPVGPLIQEPAQRKLGSKVFFVGSAVLTAAAAVLAFALLLPGQGSSSQPASGTSVAPSGDSPTTSAPATPTSTYPAPTPSFNTQEPTVTEQQAQENAVPPGTVQYATTDPVAEATVQETAPEPPVTLEPAPTEAEEATLEPTESPSDPAEITPPADASPIDEPKRPIETTVPGPDAGKVIDETPLPPPSTAPIEAPTAAASLEEPTVIASP